MGSACAAIVGDIKAAFTARVWSLIFQSCDWHLYGQGTQLVVVAPHALAHRQITQKHLATLTAATPDGVEIVVKTDVPVTAARDASESITDAPRSAVSPVERGFFASIPQTTGTAGERPAQ